MNSTKEMTALVEGHESERGLGLAEQQEHKQVQTKSEIQVSAPTVKASKVSLAPTQSSQPESKSISPTTTIMKDDGDISVAESEAFSFASDPSVDPIFCVGDAVIPSPPSPKEDTIKEEPPKKMETAITRRTVPSPPSPSIRQNSMVVVQTPPQARTRRSPSAKMSLSKSSPRRRKRLSNLDLSNTPTIVEVENEDQDEMMDIGTMNIGPEDESFVRLLQFIRHSNYFHPHELPLEGIDVLIQKRVRFFQLAQAERKKRYEFKPYGIIGLYTNLADIRADLLWAGDTAKNLEQHLPYIRWETFELKRRRLIQAYFTYTILLASAVTMVLAFRENGWAIEPLQENILVGPTSQVLLDMGALQTKLLVDHGEYYRLFTSIFVHAGLIHLMINLLAIWLLCGCLETNHGPMMAGIIFLVSAVGGNMWSAVMQPGYILVGASGGIFGVFGALIADCVLNWKLLFHVLRSRTPQRNQCVYVCITISLLLLDVILNSIVGCKFEFE
jgi:membrane associated rhomboid family serine protease